MNSSVKQSQKIVAIGMLSIIAGVSLGFKLPAAVLLDPLTIFGSVAAISALFLACDTVGRIATITFISAAAPVLAHQLTHSLEASLITATFATISAALIVDRIIKGR